METESLTNTASKEDETETDSGVVLTSSSSTTSTPPPTDEPRAMCGLTELVSSCLSSGKKAKGQRLSPSSSAASIASTSDGSADEIKAKRDGTQPFLRVSQFSNVPPTIRFYTKGTKVSKPNKKVSSHLTWCHNSLLPIVMRQSLAASHFKVVDESLLWIGYWGRHLKSADYKNIKPYQKVNHFPGAFHIGRKDRLWTHVREQIERFGDEFRIVPETYILPKETDALEEYLGADPAHHVILKPPASARGAGITVTRKMKEVKPGTPLVAQHYVARPMTINGAKFDLRFYAYIPCLEPLRVYLYEEGLVRFASVPYSHSMATVSNKYMHLTNYSINKLAEKEGVLSSPVPKWRLSELWKYFEERGINSKKVLTDIEAVITKAFIACERPIREHMVKTMHCGYTCHELFGVDILLDEEARPWMLEANISPSLHSGTPLDISVKAPLAKDVLNMAGIYVVNDSLDAFMSSSVYASRPRKWPASDRHVAKERSFEAHYAGEGAPPRDITLSLTAEDLRMLVEFEDEYVRRGAFRLLFPTQHTIGYLKYFSQPVYANLLLSRWQQEQAVDRGRGLRTLEALCRQGVVLVEEHEDGPSAAASSQESDEEDEDSDQDEDGISPDL